MWGSRRNGPESADEAHAHLYARWRRGSRDPNSPLARSGLATWFPWAPPSPLREGAPACSTAPRQPPSGRGTPASLTSGPAGRPLRCARTQRRSSRGVPVPARKAGAGWPAARMRAPSIAGLMAAHASALRALTRGRRPNAANAVSEVSSAAGHETEKRRAVGAQRRPLDLSATGQLATALSRRPSNAISNGRSGS